MKNDKYDPGVYLIRLIKPAFGFPAGHLIYIGKGDNVEARLKVELEIMPGHGTFFRSIGLLLGKTVIPHSGRPRKGYNFKL